jgi:hypothetical protein
VEKYWLVELAHSTPGHYSWVTHKEWLSAKKIENPPERLEPTIKHIISIFIPTIHAHLKVSDLLEKDSAVWDDFLWMVDWGETEPNFFWEENWRLRRFKGEGRAFLHRLRMNWFECRFYLRKEKALKSNSIKMPALEQQTIENERNLLKQYQDIYKEKIIAKDDAANVLLFKLVAGVKMRARMVLKFTQQHLLKEAP